MDSQSYSSSRLDHLGLVAGMCQEVGVSSLIDSYFPNQSQTKQVSYGQLVVAMILNGLGFVGRTLHMYPEYFADKPVERLIGSGIKAEQINDDALGRCLDKLYETGVSSIYQALGERTVSYLGLNVESTHLDSTSFHVDGKYAVDDDFSGIHITQGYSRDHRPDLNQVILNLITENQAGLPVYMQACSGNANDSESFKKIIKSHISSLKAAQASRYLVGDASLYVAETIQSLTEQGQYFISRVPQKLTDAKKAIAEASSSVFCPLNNGYSAKWIDANYANVEQRWLLVKSEQAFKREKKTLYKQVMKTTQAAQSSFKKLTSQTFSCEADAKTALAKWERAQKYTSVSLTKIRSTIKYDTPGRPKSGDTGKVCYQIDGQLITCLEKVESAIEKKGLFIIATNDCSNDLTMQQLLDHYKSQQAVERGFRFLKSPDFLVSSFFLKKPERIEAFLMIMTCCLMIYAALEYQIRMALLMKNVFFPDMKNKPSQKPTARWVFQCFQGIEQLTINDTSTIIINLKERHTIIIQALGDTYQKIYS